MDKGLAQIERLDSLEPPGWVEWVAGIKAGTVGGGAVLYGGYAVGVAIT